VIEYKNAVKAGPRDAQVRWKLAKAALDLSKEFPGAEEAKKTLATLK